MGHEIVYCYKCQTRILGTEFAKGAAFQFGNHVCCRACATELLNSLPPQERELLQAEMSKGSQDRKQGSSTHSLPALTSSSTKMRAAGPPGGVERRKSGEAARQAYAQRASRNMILAGIAAFVVAAVIFLMARSGGSPAPTPSPGPTPGPSATPLPSPAEDRRLADARDEVAKAREFARLNPDNLDGQIAAWRGAQLTTDRTPQADEVRRELERLLNLQKESIRKAFAELETRVKDSLAREEFAAVLDLCRTQRARFAAPEWTLAVDRRIEETRRAATDRMTGLKGQAAEARKRNAADEMKALRDRVRKWGLPDLEGELEAILADAPAPAPAPEPAPAPAPDPKPVSKEMEAYLGRWDAAFGRAAAGDPAGAAQDFAPAVQSLTEAALRSEATEDLESLRRIGAAVQEVRELVGRTAKGQKVTLERWNDAGAGEKIEGTVAAVEPGRLLVRREDGVVAVEIGELTPGAIADLFLARPAKKPGDERTAALLGVLGGDVDRASRLKVELPERWRKLAARAPAFVAAGREAEARRLYVEADDAAQDPVRIATAQQNLKTLLAEYATTAFVARNRALLAARPNLGKEYLFYPDQMRGAGSFKLGKAAKADAAWVSEKDSDPATQADNYLELAFTALPDAEYRLWIYAGACCLETFAFSVQGTDMVLPAAKSTAVEPGGAAWIPIRPPLSLKKTHASHGGPKTQARWEWIPIPLPKYAKPGPKVVRILTDQQAFAVAYASVSALTSSSPRESEIKELEKLRIRRSSGDREVPGLVAYWPLDEGTGTTTAEAAGRMPPGLLQGAAWARGRWGGGLRFDGADSYVELPNSAALDTLAEGSYTLTAWFQPEDLPSGSGSQNNGAYGVVMKAGMHSGLSYNSGGSFQMMQWYSQPGDASKYQCVAVGTKAFPAGVFHHIAGVIDRGSGSLHVYVNGKIEATTKFDASLRAWNYGGVPWRIGTGGPRFPEWRWCSKGVVDEVRFYNRALTAAEIEAVFRNPGMRPAAKRPGDSAGGKPWQPIFDGKSADCLRVSTPVAWVAKDGVIVSVPGTDNAAQTHEEFKDGDLRIRLESRGNSNLWFVIRQNGPNGYKLDLKQLGEAMNQGDHEVIYTCRGDVVTATIDGKPARVEMIAPSAMGMLQFNGSPDGSLRIKSIEFRAP